MTDTEAKALALVNEICGSSWLPHEIERIANFKALCHYIESTEARHAAELREQAERFSDALKRYYGDDGCQPHSILSPFILPKPDPLVEVISEVRVSPRLRSDQEMAAEIHAALAARGGKIVWEAGE